MHTLYNRLRDFLKPSSTFNITLKLDTDQVRGFLFKAKANLVWPRVLGGAIHKGSNPSNNKQQSSDGVGSTDDFEEDVNGEGIVHFPLTQVGNSSFCDVLLKNPSETALYFHLVPFSVYPNGMKVTKMLPSRNQDISSSLGTPVDYSETGPMDTFRVLSVLDSNTKTPLRSYSDDVEAKLGAQLHPDTKAFVLQAGHTAKVRVRFRPLSAGTFRSALFVRNNLTGVEILSLRAQSVYGSLSFGSWKSNVASNSGSLPASTLFFEVKEKHLKDCQRTYYYILSWQGLMHA